MLGIQTRSTKKVQNLYWCPEKREVAALKRGPESKQNVFGGQSSGISSALLAKLHCYSFDGCKKEAFASGIFSWKLFLVL
jgi:hypothetical protein